MNRAFKKWVWKFWEMTYSLSWFLFGNLPITWDIKAKRNKAYFAYVLHRD